ncbi:response regulator transcription factor [Algiphilus sp.]|uniref:response regulator transcription factor n=1 Tax=Algiphilus sp. TaxID=1872431 RepID=UPI0025BED316|nr:response regulator transcription factor [Algiphilus sp.]MCK5771071.1 response regulator transcription factor [Algiphilus sp.]
MPGDWILVVDDHPLFAAAVSDIVTQLAPETGVEIADSVAAARALVTRLGAPRLALLDLNLPDSPASRSLEALGAMADGAPVVVISAHDDPLRVRQAMAAGAVGFISKSQRPQRIMRDLAGVLAGAAVAPPVPEPAAATRELPLSPRQREVLDGVAAGRSNKEIAAALGVSPGTVKVHLREIFARLGARNRMEAVALYHRGG